MGEILREQNCLRRLNIYMEKLSRKLNRRCFACSSGRAAKSATPLSGLPFFVAELRDRRNPVVRASFVYKATPCRPSVATVCAPHYKNSDNKAQKSPACGKRQTTPLPRNGQVYASHISQIFSLPFYYIIDKSLSIR